eukprot:GHVQ01033602.1.p1 GENE.GHVQ01033602.1~~GHVQ01033602.1.p1  ORF type:complete len:947 (+),score=183.04 GHVQ01033602.1:155-2842(+)
MSAPHHQINFTRLHLNPMELPFYQNLFRMADPQGMGYVDGAAAASFLQKSGLARPVLHEIWRLADTNNRGQMDPESFFVACRLVAHAQNGLPVANEAIALEPPSLPLFDLGTPSSEFSLHDSHQGSAPLGTMMDPNMAAVAMVGGLPDGSPSLMNMFRSVGAGSTTGPMDNAMVTWTLTEPDRQKYLSVFQNTDSNCDGFVEGMEAKELFSLSGVPDSDLMLIWNLADQDLDGRLSLNEFAVAMHLVTRRKKGMPVPSCLPPELMAVLSNGLTNLQLPSSVVPPAPAPVDETASWGDPGSGFANSPTAVTPVPPTFPGDESGGAEESDHRKKKQKDKTKKKDKSAREKNKDEEESHRDEPSFGDLVRDETEKEKYQEEERRSTSPKSLHRDDEESRRSRGSRGLRERLGGVWGESPATLIESVIEADKRISKTLADDVDSHDKDLRRLNEVSAALKQEIVREKSELERQLERKRDFEREAENVRLELEKLKEDRRKIDLERISMSRDISHYQDETLFLRQQVADMQKDIQMLTESNQMLDKSYRQTEGQLKSLDVARKNVLDSLRDERETLSREEREIAELKNTLERMRREKDDVQSKQNVLQEKLRQQDWMQSRAPTLASQNSYPPAGRSAGSRIQPSQSADLLPASQGTRGFGTSIVGGPQGQVRDSKGIPAGAPVARPTASPTRYMSTGSAPIRSDGARDSAFMSTGSAGNPPHWTIFGSTPGLGTAKSLSRQGEVERRGIEGILGDDFGSREDFTNSKDVIGTRRTDQLFAASRRQYHSEEGEYDLPTKQDEKGEGADLDDEDFSRKNSSSRSTSRARKKESEMEVRFSDNLDMDNVEPREARSKSSNRKDKKYKAGRRGITDEVVRSAGLETPSFGARSVNQSSNSVASN